MTAPIQSTPRLRGALEKTALGALAAFLVLVVASTIARLRFGVDFTDEAYYAALSYRFALGDIPYVSELNIRQNAGVLSWPFVKLWLIATGGTDGMVLFLRYVYIAVRIVVGVMVARALWRRTTRELAVTAAAVVPAFIFFTMPALSYNTWASSALTAALACLLLWRETRRPAWAAATLALVLVAAFAHPAVAPVAVLTWVALFWLAAPGDERRQLRKTCAAILGVVALVGVVTVLLLGPSNVAQLLQSAGSYTGPSASIERALALLPRLMDLSRWGIWLLVLWVALAFSRFMPTPVRAAVAAAYVVIAALANNEAVMVWWMIGAIPLVLSAHPDARDEIVIVTLLSVVAAFLIAIFSTNGVTNASVGSEMAVMMLFVALARMVPQWRGATAILICMAALSRLVLGQWVYAYRDERMIQLSAEVPNGPYRGLRTSPEKLAFLDRMQRALVESAPGRHTLIAYFGVPGAHLMVPLRPALPSTWVVHDPSDWALQTRVALAAAVARAERPILVLRLKHLYRFSLEDEQFVYPPDDPFVRAMAQARPRELLDTPDFTLLEIADPANFGRTSR